MIFKYLSVCTHESGVCVCGVDYRRTVCSGFSIQANWPKPCYIACYCQTVAAAVAPTYGLCAKYAFGHFGKCCLIYSVHCVQLPAISRVILLIHSLSIPVSLQLMHFSFFSSVSV